MKKKTAHRTFRFSLMVLAILWIGSDGTAQADAVQPKVPPGDVVLKQLELKEVSVVHAIRLIAEYSGLNLVATEAAGSKKVTLYLKRAKARLAVDTLCKVSGLWYREDKDAGLFRIMTTEEYQRDLVVFPRNVTKVFTLLYPNAIVVAQEIEDLFGDRVELSLGIDDLFLQDDSSAGGLGQGTGGSNRSSSGRNGFRGNRNRGRSRGNSDRFGSRGGRGGRQNRTRTGIADKTKLTPDQIAKLEKQTAPEAKKEALRSFSRLEPVIYVTVNRQNNLIIVRTSDSKALGEIETLILEVDRPTPQVLLELKILELDLTDDFKSVFDIDYVAGKVKAGPPTSQERNPLLPGAATAPNGVLGAGNFPLEASTLVYQFLNNHIRARIQLLRKNNRVNIMGTPMILCANNQRARIFVGEERPLVRGVKVQSTDTQAGFRELFEPEVEIRDIGTTLQIVPRINADRTVTLTILQNSSTVIKGGAIIPTSATTEFAIDTVNIAEATATIVGKDGLTIALGGLIRNEIVDSEERVPILSDIPLLGALFRREVRSRKRKELVLLITPHVLTTPAEGQSKTKQRMKALSIHPYHEKGDKAVKTFTRGEVPRVDSRNSALDAFLHPIPEPVK